MRSGNDNDHGDEGKHAMRLHSDLERGQAMVEFALVLIIFAEMLFGMIDFARYVSSTNNLNEVAREAARQGTVALRPADCNGLAMVDCVKTLTVNRLKGSGTWWVVPTDVAVVCQRLGASGALPANKDTDNCGLTWRANDIVRVKVTSKMPLVTPLIAQFIKDAPMTGEAQVTVNG